MIVNNIVTYIRTATDNEHMLALQRAQLNEFVAELSADGTEFNISEITDIGYSGLSDERPGLTEIVGKLKSGEIDVLITTDPMRLHRNHTELQKLINQLDDHGVIVEFCDDAQILKEESGLVDNILEEAIQADIANIKREARSQLIEEVIEKLKELDKQQ